VAPANKFVPGDVAEAVKVAYRASVASGETLSQRAMAERFGLSRRKVSQLVAGVRAEANGGVS
jgi:DNA-binding transcriptional regulator YdaS (Cro superfamily)